MHANFSHSLPPATPAVDADALTGDDLSPLAWVMEELRKSLEVASTALRRQLREGPARPGADGHPIDTSALSVARLALHQAAGALEMVTLAAPAQVVRAMESAVQGFIDRPVPCHEPAVLTIERAGFAVVAFLDGLLLGKALSPVALFPQYRDALTLAGAERIHPADLWPMAWTWRLADAPLPPGAQTQQGLTPQLRARLDQSVLRVVKSGDPEAASELAQVCEELALGADSPGGAQARSLWRLAAGFFEALGLSLLPVDLYVKRTASRVLVQFARLAKGDGAVSESLGKDLAFFCAQAVPADVAMAPRLMAVRQAWGLASHAPVPYDLAQFGQFDPMLLAQVRKRLVAIRESWSALAGGDTSRLRSTGEQFTQLRDAWARLHAPWVCLADALVAVAHDTTERAQPPRPELAMEVATALLFLEAACQDFDPADTQLAARMQRVADRVTGVLQGQAPQPLEAWIEALYRQVSHRQTMGSVVDELRASLADLEKELDAFFRDTQHPERLQPVPGRLTQMRGVLSVLGLDHAAQAAMHMREAVQGILQAPADAQPTGYPALVNNLGALGFLVDMLNYQPTLARKLFHFDAGKGELTPVMGRARNAASAPVQEEFVPEHKASLEEPLLLPVNEPEPGGDLGIDLVSDQAWFAALANEGMPPASAPAPEPAFVPDVIHAPYEAVQAEVQAEVKEDVQEDVQGKLQEEVQAEVGDETETLERVALAPARDDSVKVIGSLRIDQALFNVYLHEADEWSRRLQVEVSEWVLDPQQPLPPALVTLAHSLCGSASMIGFSALADLARQLEASLQRTQAQAGGTLQHGQAYTDASEEIRRLLHQFAAGFLPDSRSEVAQALAALDRSGVQAPPGLDPDLFVFFEEEALELLPQLGGALRQWHARPDNASARDEVLRALHTLKGSARLAGALSLGAQAHALESLIEGFVHEVSSATIAPVIQGFDDLQTAFDALRADGVAGSGPVPAPVAEPDPPATSEASDVPEASPDMPQPSAAVISAPSSTSATPAVTVAATPATTARAAGQTVVRVRTQLLDRLMNQTGEVMISRARLDVELGQLRGALHELTGNIERLRAQLRDLELQSELQMQSSRTKDAATDFDPLEFDRFTRVQELTRMMAESVGDVATVQRTLQRAADASEDHLLAQARQTRELQRDLLRTRMIEFESISDRLHRVVRLAAQESGKQARLDIQGGGIEMDRGILDRMTPAFEHLLRNAVAHGIEAPEARLAAGKAAIGQVLIRLAQEGNDVSIRFEDDGKGLNLPGIRDKAVTLGLWPADQALTDAEAARLIFTPGFSTAPTVSELAGRGIGMDVVRAEVHAVGGRIDTQTQEGVGTCFALVLPLTTAVTQVVMLRSADRVFGVPVPLVDVVLNAAAAAWQQARDTGLFLHEGQALPYYIASALLQSSPQGAEPEGRPATVVVLRSAAQRIALQVDEVMGHQEVVVKHLGPQLARLPGLAGVTVLPSGAVVLIYNPVALAAVHGEQARPDPAQATAPQAPSAAPALAQRAQAAPLVLVVDDSSTVRRVTQRLLQREGYRVALAGDGLQALEQLALETPALLLSDIEMPRMDGFDLVRNVRGDTRWAALPVVMITSRIAHKHQEHATALGVNHYLGKPYPEDELLALVRRYAGTDTGAGAALRPPSS